MDNLVNLRYQASKAFEFLNKHPAFIFDFSNALLWFPSPRSRFDIWEDPGNCVSIYYNDPEAERFKDEFLKEYEDDMDLLTNKPELCHIYKTHEEVYGEPWKLDTVKYWGELIFTVFDGDVSRDSDEPHDYKLWSRYCFTKGTYDSMEEFLIGMAEEVKKNLGDFSQDDFYTDEEKNNHKLTEPMFSKPLDETIFNPITQRDEKSYSVTFNPKWLSVNDGMFNRRWVTWFRETDYCKEQWGDTFDKLPTC